MLTNVSFYKERKRIQTGHSIRRLLFVSQGLTCDGGIASVARSVSCVLDELALRGRMDRVDKVLVNDDPEDVPENPANGVQIVARASKLLAIWSVWRLSNSVGYDLIFFDHIGLARMMTLPLAGNSLQRYAVFIHGIELEKLKIGNRAHKALLGANKIFTNSQYTASRIRRVTSETTARILPVPLCVEPRRANLWEQMSFGSTHPRDESVALVVGRMNAKERGKGHDQLIEAWTRVHDVMPAARLWIVGDGDDRTRYENKVHRLGLDPCVKFLGRVDDVTLGHLYRRASVFVMPSRQEGFGIVYAEAMWHALPCIASRNDAASEIIEEGRTGVLVAYGDVKGLCEKLLLCLGNTKFVERLGMAARQKAAEKFSYERFKEDLIKAITC